MNKVNFLEYLNACKDKYEDKLKELSNSDDRDRSCMLSGAMTCIENIIQNIESGSFD